MNKQHFPPVNIHLGIMLEGVVVSVGGILWRGNVLTLFGHDASGMKCYWQVRHDRQ